MKKRYICKCGKIVYKSTNADTTGNRDTEHCAGCPHLLPWGPDEYVVGQGFVKNVKGHECRMSKCLEYGSRFRGNLEDKTTCSVVSLDFAFLQQISDWIAETYPDRELWGSFSPDKIRPSEYCSNGRYRMSIACAQNKKGIAAKAALLHQFFDDSGYRKDKTPEEEKAIVLAAIEEGKAAARRKEDKEEHMETIKRTNDRGIMTDAGELLPNGSECRRYAVSRVRAGMGKVQAVHVCDDQPDGVKIWLNASYPGEYWVLREAGKIEGEHVESCPYCAAILKIGCGDVLLVPFGKELESNKLPKIPEQNNEPVCSCAGCKREDCTCAGGRDAADRTDCAGEQNCAQSGCTYAVKHRANPTPADADASPCAPGASDVPPLPSQSAAADVQQGGGDDTANPTSSDAATAAAGTTADGPELSDSAGMTEATAANTCALEGTANENTGVANEDNAPDVCPYLELIENSRKYNCQCSICGDRFVNTEICNKSFRGCGWYLDQQDKTDLSDDDENEIIDKSDCLCRTCGRESCFAHGCAKECPVNADESCLTVSCPEYIERTDTTCDCKKIFAPNGDAAASTDESAAKEPQPEETPITPTNASNSSAPACPADAGAATQSLSAADAASLAADPTPAAFDYTGLDAQTVADLHLAEREYAGGKKMAEMGLRRMADAVAIAHDTLCGELSQIGTTQKHGNRGEDTFRRWCESMRISKSAAYRFLNVSGLFDRSTPREQKVLGSLGQSLVYEISKPSAPAELVQSAKDGNIATLKQFKELEAQLKAEQEARKKAEHDAQRYREDSEKAREAAHTYHCQYEQVNQQRNALLDQQTEYISRIEAAEKAKTDAQSKAARYAEMKDAALKTLKNEREKQAAVDAAIEQVRTDARASAAVDVLFDQLENTVDALQAALETLEDTDIDKAEKLRRSLARLLQTLAAQMGVG